MDYLRVGGQTLSERVVSLGKRYLDLVREGYDPTIHADMPPAEKTARLAANLERRYFVIDQDNLFPPGLTIDRKHGLFDVHLLKDGETDLRPLKRELYGKLQPEYLRPDGVAIPGLTEGFVFGMHRGGSKQYLCYLTDMLSALVAFDSLWPMRRELLMRGMISAQFPDGVAAAIHGIRKKRGVSEFIPGEVQVYVKGIPSREGLEKAVQPDTLRRYDPTYALETAPRSFKETDHELQGIFNIQPSSPAWSAYVFNRMRRWGEYFAPETVETGKRMKNLITPIGFHDILGMYLADSMLVHNLGLELNHPFLRFNKTLRQLAVDLYKRGVVMAGGEPQLPSQFHINPALAAYIQQRPALLSEKEAFGRVSLTHA